MVEWLFLALPWVCLRFVIVVFPDHTHYFLHMNLYKMYAILLQKWCYIMHLDECRLKLYRVEYLAKANKETCFLNNYKRVVPFTATARICKICQYTFRPITNKHSHALKLIFVHKIKVIIMQREK